MKKNSSFGLFRLLFIIIIISVGFSVLVDVIEGMKTFFNNYENENKYVYNDSAFNIITTPENKVLEETIKKYFDKKNVDVNIVYADNLDIVSKVNSKEKYDAIWSSNSIWLNMLDSSVVSTSNLKSTSVTPIVFAVKKSIAENLNLVNKKVTMNDLLNLIKDGKLTFSMANPITTNSGASAYLNILQTLAGNPEVLTSNHLKDSKLQENIKTFFTGLKRTSGDEDFLEESFVKGDYDAAITYESSIININKKLVKDKKEVLYAIYPVDGVSISDSPLVYVNNKNDKKKDLFLEFQSYILSSEGQKILLDLGRRTWYGGVNDKAPSDIFNKDWGIDTTKYISPIKYPSKSVISEALLLYQEKLRKPVHVVFCLDYSGSMYGEGIKELKEAMEYLFSEKAVNNLIQFSENDKIDIVAFSSDVNLLVSGKGNEKDLLLDKINSYYVGGSTALYPAASYALELLKNEVDSYNTSVILMTDGEGNVGRFADLKKKYKEVNKEIPIYSITFGDASDYQLSEISGFTNGKVFDGKNDLVEAFKNVRGYN